jgi:hypothetical protein
MTSDIKQHNIIVAVGQKYEVRIYEFHRLFLVVRRGPLGEIYSQIM